MRFRFSISFLLIFWLATPLGHAQQLQIRPLTDLAFGEIVLPGPGPGYFQLNPGNGAFDAQNAIQIGTPTLGSFELSGKNNGTMYLTISAQPLVCDTTYIGNCVGAPTITPLHNFNGVFSTGCPAPPARCRQTFNLGGRLSFTGMEEGRWTAVLTLISDYQ